MMTCQSKKAISWVVLALSSSPVSLVKLMISLASDYLVVIPSGKTTLDILLFHTSPSSKSSMYTKRVMSNLSQLSKARGTNFNTSFSNHNAKLSLKCSNNLYRLLNSSMEIQQCSSSNHFDSTTRCLVSHQVL